MLCVARAGGERREARSGARGLPDRESEQQRGKHPDQQMLHHSVAGGRCLRLRLGGSACGADALAAIVAGLGGHEHVQERSEIDVAACREREPDVGANGVVVAIDLAKIDSYERKNDNRTTVLSRITTLRGQEPWPGYDELTVAEIEAVLGEGDEQRAKDVAAYERAHKNRAGVLRSAERETANA